MIFPAMPLLYWREGEEGVRMKGRRKGRRRQDGASMHDNTNIAYLVSVCSCNTIVGGSEVGCRHDEVEVVIAVIILCHVTRHTCSHAHTELTGPPAKQGKHKYSKAGFDLYAILILQQIPQPSLPPIPSQTPLGSS
jgi:hypothetical protein